MEPVKTEMLPYPSIWLNLSSHTLYLCSSVICHIQQNQPNFDHLLFTYVCTTGQQTSNICLHYSIQYKLGSYAEIQIIFGTVCKLQLCLCWIWLLSQGHCMDQEYSCNLLVYTGWYCVQTIYKYYRTSTKFSQNHFIKSVRLFSRNTLNTQHSRRRQTVQGADFVDFLLGTYRSEWRTYLTN